MFLFVLPISFGNHFKSATINGTTFNRGDDVYVYLSQDRSTKAIARIVDLYKATQDVEDAGVNVAVARWFYTADDIPREAHVKAKRGEVFMSFHEDHIPIESLETGPRPTIKHADADPAHRSKAEKEGSEHLFVYSQLWDQKLHQMYSIMQ